MELDKVTVIITSYNGANVIEKAINSVINQSYKNIEIIVVDDNGLNTLEQKETEKIVKKYPNVIYIAHEENMNGACARNTGVKKSSGKYICFLDDDDFYYEKRIEEQLNKMNVASKDIAFSYCAFNEIFPNNKNRTINVYDSENLLYEYLLMKIRIGSSTIMLRKDVIEEIGGFDESFKRHQDWEFLCRVLDKYNAIALNSVGLGKVVLNRNAPKSAEKIEMYRLYYLEKMKNIINKFPEKDQKNIYKVHYSAIAKEYFCENNYNKFFEYSKLSKNFMYALFISIRSKIYRGIIR